MARSMTPPHLPVVAAALFVLGACADPIGEPSGGATDGPQLYEANTTVLESPDHGPELCFGGVADSLPPQCGGVPIEGWDWQLVEGEESLAGTTWGDFRVMGTYDGERFTLVEAGPYRAQGPDDHDITVPCPEPAGGWSAPDPERATEADLRRVMRAAEAEPDSAGFWIDYVHQTSESTPPEETIAVAAFTGDLERHERELRELWGGPLCLVEHERTMDELLRAQRELGGDIRRELGLQVTWSGTFVVENVVDVGVVVAPEEVGRAVDERYGEGAVRLVPGLVPVG